jgi:23S rRNA (cytosine1962-C5)-methyltransferase
MSPGANGVRIELLTPAGWDDYELIDSGDSRKLERFGKYVLDRPEPEAIWRPRLASDRWARADATFRVGEDGNEGWVERTRVGERWLMRHDQLCFWSRLTPFRHTGVFPEQSVNWRWIARQIEKSRRPMRVLDLFGYTGIASLAAAAAGASVTYLDASKQAMAWARDNQIESGLHDRPIRWILDDALKFVRREARRGTRYEAIIMDPPVFGRGAKGEIWRFPTGFPQLIDACREVLADEPIFVLVNAYAIDFSSVMLGNVLADLMAAHRGTLSIGELALAESGNGRLLSTGIFGRWAAGRSDE